MKLSRNATLAIQFLLDQCLPPVLRDSRWFMWLPFRLVCGDKTDLILNFKEKALTMTDAEFRSAYEAIAPVNIDRETDLNANCIARICADVIGPNVLEMGCGRGFLSQQLTRQGLTVTAADMRIPESARSGNPDVTFVETNIEAQPFENGEFDTVICTHTLEHVQNFALAVKELRRVAATRLIIVVPKQRNYLYTFDLHLHFFPYPHDLVRAMGKHGIAQTCEIEGGDLYFIEQLATKK
jgi:ubiquinone/menaquinone biosynthesis C-methylase UbiE